MSKAKLTEAQRSALRDAYCGGVCMPVRQTRPLVRRGLLVEGANRCAEHGRHFFYLTDAGRAVLKDDSR